MDANVGRQVDSAFKRLHGPVWIITAAVGERRGGLLATMVAKSSIDPARPCVLVGLGANHFTAELVAESGAFGLHLLRPSQLDVAWRFALESGRTSDKLAGLPLALGATGAPLLEDVLAQLECRVFDRHDGGDRLYFWGEVISCQLTHSGTPLDDASLVRSATAEQLARLNASLESDQDLQQKLRLVRRPDLAGE